MLDTSCICVSWHYPQRNSNAAFGQFIVARFLTILPIIKLCIRKVQS
jgi:hypothetical protein